MADSASEHVSSNITPRHIWFLWLQGPDEALPVVRACHDSWLRKNPEWDLHFVSRQNLAMYSDIDLTALDHLGASQLADLIRLDLLLRHGGVWADATCFCIRPLDSWLPAYTGSGFFAFAQPGRDRLIASWFLASTPNNFLVKTLYSKLSQYLRNPNLSNDGKAVRRTILEHSLKINPWTTRLWFSRIVANGLGVYPYFAFHYMFAEVIRTNATCADIWTETPRFSAAIGMRLELSGLFSSMQPATQAEIDQRRAPLYKLTWKYDPEDLNNDSTLAYLLQL